MGNYSSLVCLITGASSGIGAALSREMAARGATLVLVARRIERLESLADELRRRGSKVLVRVCDVTKPDDLAQVVEMVKRELGRLDVVVANAGFGVVGHVQSLTLDDFHRQFETNIFGVLRTIQATAEELKRSRGRLALVGSVNGYIALTGNSAYCMSKFAVRALAESLSGELEPSGVSVTFIAPGFVKSEIRQVNNRGAFNVNARDPVPEWIQMSAEAAAKDIARAILRRRREAVITGHGKVLVWLKRHFPGLLTFLLRLFKVSARAEP